MILLRHGLLAQNIKYYNPLDIILLSILIYNCTSAYLLPSKPCRAKHSNTCIKVINWRWNDVTSNCTLNCCKQMVWVLWDPDICKEEINHIWICVYTYNPGNMDFGFHCSCMQTMRYIITRRSHSLVCTLYHIIFIWRHWKFRRCRHILSHFFPLSFPLKIVLSC